MARDTFTLLYLTCLLVGVSMSQDPNPMANENTTSDVESLRKTLWIVTGALGGVLLLVLILVLALAVAVSRIKSQFTSKRERYVHSSSIEDNNTGAISSPNIRQGRPSPRQEIHAYDNSAFNPGAHEMEERRDRDSKVEVERLGYEMYNGKHENSYADPADLKSTLKVTDDGDDIDDDSGRVSPPYGVVQPPELPQRSDLDLKRSTTTTINPNQSTGLFCCTATKAVRRTYID